MLKILTFHWAKAPTQTAMKVRLRLPGVVTKVDHLVPAAWISISMVRLISAISNWIRGCEVSPAVWNRASKASASRVFP